MSALRGLPPEKCASQRSAQRGMGCHRITGPALQEMKKDARYYARGEPIPWVRVNKLPEFAYFPHKAHIRARVTCQTCHGPVETMTTFGAETGPRLTNDLLTLVALRPAPRPRAMARCVDCNRRQHA